MKIPVTIGPKKFIVFREKYKPTLEHDYSHISVSDASISPLK